MNDRAATIASLVNGVVVAVGPPTLLAVLGAVNDTAVHPAGYSYVLAALAGLSPIVIGLSPFAMLAAWRTFVYAKRRREGSETGWRGVLEAGAAGFLAVLLLLSRGIVTKPSAAAPYIIVYGGVALLLGLVLGVVLLTTGVLVLHICREPRAQGS